MRLPELLVLKTLTAVGETRIYFLAPYSGGYLRVIYRVSFLGSQPVRLHGCIPERNQLWEVIFSKIWKYAFYIFFFQNPWKRSVREFIFSKVASLQLLDVYFANFYKLHFQLTPFSGSFQNNLQGEVDTQQVCYFETRALCSNSSFRCVFFVPLFLNFNCFTLLFCISFWLNCWSKTNIFTKKRIPSQVFFSRT